MQAEVQFCYSNIVTRIQTCCFCCDKLFFIRQQNSVVASIFFVLADHNDSCDLTELYHKSLERFLEAQTEIGMLASKGRFVSLGPNPGSNVFNKNQEGAILEWIAK